jgi:hypothetical protein
MSSDNLYFPARELKPYAEPVSPEALSEGRVYFAVQFIDGELLIPTVEPPGLYFQDAESYHAGVRVGSGDENEKHATVYAQRTVKHIFEYERALDQLLICALRRQRASGR